MNDAGQRLREERERLGYSQKAFGDLGGVSKNTQLAYENGSSSISLDYLFKLGPVGLDIYYVAMGKGHDREDLGRDQEYLRRRYGLDEPSEDTVELAQVDLRYGMGGTFADGPIEVERRPFSREWLRSITATAPRHLFWAIGDGDSMEPTIRSGEIILIDRSQDTPRMDDGIWAVTHGEIGMIKRLRHRPEGIVELHSDNHLVRPQTAVDGELHVIGRVIAVVRKL